MQFVINYPSKEIKAAKYIVACESTPAGKSEGETDAFAG